MFKRGDKVLYSDYESNFTGTVRRIRSDDRVIIDLDPEYQDSQLKAVVADPDYLEFAS